jgi:phage head maturation protease
MTDNETDVRASERTGAPKMRRAAEVGAQSYDATAHTVDVVWSTGAPVRRRDWRSGTFYIETLDMAPSAVRLGRLNAGAPFLDTHDDSNLRSVIGSVVPGSAKVVGGKGLCKVLLSRAEEHEGVVGNIIAGVIRNVSVGYANHRIEVTENSTGDDEWRVVDWEPMEISAVPVPADAGAQIRSDPGEVETRAERIRVTEIRALASEARMAELGNQHITTGSTLGQFRAALLEELVNREAPNVDNNVSITVGLEHAEKRAAALANVIRHRADNSVQLLPGAGEFRGMSLLEMARDTLEAHGVKTRGMSGQEIASAAFAHRSGSGYHSTSDFPAILGNVVNSTLRAGYEAAGQTFRPLVHQVTVPNFKEVARSQLGEAPGLEKVNESGEFKRGTMTEGQEKYKIATYGKIIGITRQAIVNDDLGAFGRIPQSFGVQAAQLESDLVWYQILANPVMGDSVALFHANHKNLATAAALGIAPIGKMRTAMAQQTGLDGKTVLNIVPATLIVPVALETEAEQLLRSTYYPQSASAAAPDSMRRLRIISEPRLDNGISNPSIGPVVAGSATAFYLAASPTQVDVVELAYLEGSQGVYTETRQGFDVDGLEVKVRLDVGAKTIDHRGLQKNAGQ